jgi:alpha-tubulin suppressor-like RCC1 family protein
VVAWRIAWTAALVTVLGLVGVGPVGPAAARQSVAVDLVSPAATAWTWGASSFGQLGDETTTARLTPGPVPGLSDIIDLHGGREHVIALRADHTVWVWGSNGEGQLGLGTTANRSTPTQVPGLTDVQAVETGHNSSLALMSDGSVRTWGLNADGQLGDGSTTLRRSPVRVVGLTDTVQVAAGRDMSYAIRADGTLVAWGRNDEGQLGDGSTVRRTTPVPVRSLTDVVEVAGGRDHGLALRSDGSVWAWGSNDYGQVGDGTTTDRTTPVQVMTGATQVIAGAQHSYALRADGTVAAWGRNFRDNLGDGTTTTRTRPVSVRNISGAVSIGSGRDTGLAVLSDGRVMAWGNNSTGQLGDGTTTTRSTPVVVPGISGAVFAGGGGAEYSVVLVSSGPPPPQDPVASFTTQCDLLSCTYDASGSDDPDGAAVGYAWDFGDRATTSATVPTVHHDYDLPGTYDVTLTVTDDSGATDIATRQVVVQDVPPPVTPQWRAGNAVDANSARPSLTIPSGVQPGDRLLLFVSANRAATLTTPAGWTLLGTVSDDTEVRSWVLTRVAAAGQAGTSLQLGFEATAKASIALEAYADAGAPSALTSRAEPSSTRTHSAPAAPVAANGSSVLRYYVDKGATAHTWALAPALVSRAATTGSGSGFLTTALGEQRDVTAGTAPALTATSGIASAKAICWTLVLPPA